MNLKWLLLLLQTEMFKKRSLKKSMVSIRISVYYIIIRLKIDLGLLSNLDILL